MQRLIFILCCCERESNMQSRKSQGRQNHFRKLVSEALNGEYPMEKLPSPAYDFAEERQAVYYSKMRYNMESDMSVMVMKHHQQLTELELMKKWKKEARTHEFRVQL